MSEPVRKSYSDLTLSERVAVRAWLDAVGAGNTVVPADVVPVYDYRHGEWVVDLLLCDSEGQIVCVDGEFARVSHGFTAEIPLPWPTVDAEPTAGPYADTGEGGGGTDAQGRPQADGERRTVWVVIGDEYAPVAVFASAADAQAAVLAGYGSDWTELDWYPTGSQPVHVSGWRLVGRIDAVTGDVDTTALRDGRWITITEPVKHEAYTFDEWMHPADASRRAVTAVTEVTYHDDQRYWIVMVSTRTEEYAREVFCDLVAQTRTEILDGTR